MDYIFVPLILFFGFRLKYHYSIFNTKDRKLLKQLFLFHMVFSYLFYLYLNANGGDALFYWNSPKNGNFAHFWNLFSESFAPSPTMWLINFFPSNLLNLSFFAGCMLYGVLGYWGLLYLLIVIKTLFPNYQHLSKLKILNISIFPIILFLPNFHFWSSGVGKDTLSFFVVCLSFYVAMNLKKRWYLFIIPGLLLYFIRPHILLFLVAGLTSSYLIKSKLYLFQKVILLIIAVIIFLPFLNSVLEFAKIEDASMDSLDQFNTSKSSALSNAGSGVDLQALPYPLQILTFLYRPLFFDAHNIFAIIASFENLIWIFLSVNFLRNNPLRVFKKSHYFILGGFLFWIIGAVAFAPVMSNLGIIIRERNMFLPGFILFSIAGLYNTKKFKNHIRLLYLQREHWLKSQKKKNKALHSKG